MSTALLDPKNDYVFKRLFAEAPELLLALINDLRPDLPPITSVEVLNPNIEAGELSGKYIFPEILAPVLSTNCKEPLHEMMGTSLRSFAHPTY